MFSISDSLNSRLARVLVLYSVLWAVPVVLQILGSSREVLVPAVVFCGLIGLLVSLYFPESTLLSIPFLALLAPIAGDIILIGQARVWTDYLVPVYLASALYRKITKPKSGISFSPWESGFFFILAMLYLISYLLGLLQNRVALIEPLYYLACFFLIFLLFQTTATSLLVCQKTVLACQVAVCLASCLIFHAFIIGQELLLVRGDEAYASKAAERFSDAGVFRRTAFYYAGFHFCLGMLILGNLLRLQNGFDGRITKALLWIQCGILSFAVLLLNNKTAMMSVALGWLASWYLFKLKIKSLPFVLCVMVGAIGVFAGFKQINEKISLSILSPDEALGSAGSFMVRTEIWHNALKKFFDSPKVLVFGYGPNVLETGESETGESLLVSQQTGVRENAMDSTWLTWTVELGLISFFLLTAGYFYTLIKMTRAQHLLAWEPSFSNLYYTIYGGLLYCGFAFFTQSVGYAKISWLVLLFFLLGLSLPDIMKTKNKNLRRNHPCHSPV